MTEYRYRFYTGHETQRIIHAGKMSWPEFVEIGRPKLDQFSVTRLTPAGAWINSSTSTQLERFVLNGRGKRFAHETPEWAFESWKARSVHYERRLSNTLQKLREAMEYATLNRKQILEEVKKIYEMDLLNAIEDPQIVVVDSLDVLGASPHDGSHQGKPSP